MPTLSLRCGCWRAGKLGVDAGRLAGLMSSQPKIGARRAELWTLIGLAMIMASIVSLDEDQNVPGLLALPARLETALLIGVGPEQRPTVTRLLSARPVVALAWYFSYLWHWPILAFARYHLDRPLRWDELTILSWR